MTTLLALAATCMLALSQWLIFSYAPVEQSMGIIQKIFYPHLALAWWALISFFTVFAASLLFLVKRRPVMDNICAAAAEIGVLFSGLALLTGMLWAKKAWGVWWTWDPRLSTTLIMWFIYAGYLLARQLDLPENRKKAICAVIGIVAFLDVPLVFFSARIFRSIHPAIFASETGGLEPEMKLTALATVAGFGLLWATMLLLRSRQIHLKSCIDKLAQDRNQQ